MSAENEHLFILKIPEPRKPQGMIESVKDWKQFVGVLKSSPNLNGNLLLIQQEMRNEWD